MTFNSFWFCFKFFWIRRENKVRFPLNQKKEGKWPSENLCFSRAWGHMHKLQTTKKRQNKGFFLVFSVVYVVGKVVFLQLKKKGKRKKRKSDEISVAEIRICRIWSFYSKTWICQTFQKRKPSMKDEVNLPKVAPTSAVHSSPFT